MTPPRRGHIAAIIATLAGAIYALSAAAFVTWFYSGLAVADVFIPWDIVIPFLLQVAIYALAAIGLMRRWRAAFLGAFALHLLTLIRWGGLVAVGNAFVFEWTSVLAVVLAAIGLGGLWLARPLFRRAPEEVAQ